MENEYTIEAVQITPKTVAYRVDFGNYHVATFGKRLAAERFADYMQTNNVKTISEYLALPWEFRREFIVASNSDRPNLPHY